MRKIVNYILFISVILIFDGCKREQKYSDTPHIEFDSFEITRNQLNPDNLTMGDYLVIKIKFQDGDGDLGIANNDSSSSGDNYILEIFQKQSGAFESLFFDSGQYPYLSTDNVVGPIDGTLSRTIFIPHSSPIVPNDTLRFDITILDRALNESNTITTPSIIVYK